MDETPLLVTLTHSSDRRGPSPSRECPIVPRKPPFLPRSTDVNWPLGRLQLSSTRWTPSRAHTNTHTHIRTLLRPPISRHAPFKTSNTLLTKVFGRVSVYGPLRPLLGHSAKEIRSASHLFHRENYGFSVRTARSAIVSQKGHTRLSKKFARVSVQSYLVVLWDRRVRQRYFVKRGTFFLLEKFR